MSLTRSFAAAAVGATLLLAACGDDTTSSSATPTTEVMVDETMTDETMVDDMTEDSMVDEMTDETMTEDSMVDETMTEDSMVDETMDDTMTTWSSWPRGRRSRSPTSTAPTFTLGDFMGKPVFVENFATWCPKCREQLGTTNDAAGTLGDDAVFIALSVETDLSAADVAEYAADNGFDNIRFAVMTPEFLAAISDAYGNSSINPPSTPHFVIDIHGAAGELDTGSKSADDIVKALQTAAM
jgi:thiol-disulfide isomerase/thioredoxin